MFPTCRSSLEEKVVDFFSSSQTSVAVLLCRWCQFIWNLCEKKLQDYWEKYGGLSYCLLGPKADRWSGNGHTKNNFIYCVFFTGHVTRIVEVRCAKTLVGNPEGKRPVSGLRCSWEDNIKTDYEWRRFISSYGCVMPGWDTGLETTNSPK
jgi:hypothetical protein